MIGSDFWRHNDLYSVTLEILHAFLCSPSEGSAYIDNSGYKCYHVVNTSPDYSHHLGDRDLKPS